MTDVVDINVDQVARHIARSVRGCTTDEQYTELVERISAEITRAVNELARLHAALSSAREDERERCAKVAEAVMQKYKTARMGSFAGLKLDAAKEVAASIRALKDYQ